MYNHASIYKGGGVYNLGDGASTKLPAKTLRFLFSNPDYDPTVAGVGSIGTWQKVDTAAANVWDWTASSDSFNEAFNEAFTSSDNMVDIIAAGDTSSITTIRRAFRLCSSLKSICLFDTSNVTSFYVAFNGCSNLIEIPQFNTSQVTSFESAFRQCSKIKKVPLLDTSSAINVSRMFYDCRNVEEGALELYTQMSTQTTPPSNTSYCFGNCGINTTTGAAELAQIPADWGGTAPATLDMGAPQNLTEPLSPSVIEDDGSLTN